MDEKELRRYIDIVIKEVKKGEALPDSYKPPHSFHKQFVLLKSPRGDWNFVKGHKESQETDHDTFKREIFEETGSTSGSRLLTFNQFKSILEKIMRYGLLYD